MKIKANFIKDGKWWVAWTEDVPGALTQGETQEEARENLIDAVNLMREPIDLSALPTSPPIPRDQARCLVTQKLPIS